LELAEALGYLSGARLSDLRLARTHCARLVTALSRRIVALSGNAAPGNASSGNR